MGSPLLTRFDRVSGGGVHRWRDGAWARRIGQAHVLAQNMDHEVAETSTIGARQGLQSTGAMGISLAPTVQRRSWREV